jgi:inosine-uridine nucleoside N-ribohydrolase
LGAITNIAKLIHNHGDIVYKIKELIFMASSTKEEVKGVTPYVGFNIGKDPEAAEVIVKSQIPLVIVPTELGKKCYLDWEEVVRTKNSGSAGALLENLYRYYKDRQIKNGIPTYDSTAIFYMIDSSMYTTVPANIEIKYYKDAGTGVGVIDYEGQTNCVICKDIDVEKFKNLYFKLLKKIK